MRKSAAIFFLLLAVAHAQRLSPLAPPPDWAQLEAAQETITRAEFERLLAEVYAPGDAAAGLIELRGDEAIIRKNLTPGDTFTLRFAADAATAKKAPRPWRTPRELGPAPAGKPLTGARIALDPGHLGGPWARIEERWMRVGELAPVTEGDLTLRVAEHLAPHLAELGAEVLWVRHATEPATADRPETLRDIARAELMAQGVAEPRETYDDPRDPTRGQTVQAQSELLFYRVSEIRARARRVNDGLRPDLVVCLHFNASAWGDPGQPVFDLRNDLHLLVNGCYSAGELRFDDQRHDMLSRLLGGIFPHERAASEAVATALARATALPPYLYRTPNAVRAGSDFVWARNLLANRLYRAPVVFTEPYIMNHWETWERILAGDYEGERLVAGAIRPAIVREYADAVAAGLRDYFMRERSP